MHHLRETSALLNPAALPEYGPFQLHEPLKLLALAIEQTRIPMIMTDPCQWDNPIVLANKAFLTLTGYQAQEVRGRNCRFLQGESTSDLVIAEMRSALDGERDFAVTLLNYRKDGTAFWNELNVSHLHGSDGELCYHLASQRSALRACAGESLAGPSRAQSEDDVLELVRKIVLHTFQNDTHCPVGEVEGRFIPLKWRQEALPVLPDRHCS